MADWDAAKYHRISDPQLAWGRTVAARLVPTAGERILDVGCGTGRLTTEIAKVPDVLVVGLDPSAAMLAQALRGQTPVVQNVGSGEFGVKSNDVGARTGFRRVDWGQTPVVRLHTRRPVYVQGDAAALPFVTAFDAVFSNATFHWVPDHDRLFRSIHTALRPGGRLVAQCGGAGNLARLYGRARTLMADDRYSPFYAGWTDPWRFEGVESTRARLEAAAFADIDVFLAAAPTRFGGPDKFSEFIASVCLRHELARLPLALRDPFIAELTTLAGTDDPRFTLDYSRLNITARKRAS